MDKIDVTVQKVCSTCKTQTPLRYVGDRLNSLGEHTRWEFRIDPDEFLLCPTCGNPMRLHIQCQPHELINHNRIPPRPSSN